MSEAAVAFFNSLWISYCVSWSFTILSVDKSNTISSRLTVTPIPVLSGTRLPLLNTETLSPLFSCDGSILDFWLNTAVDPPNGTVTGKSSFIRLAVL